MAISVVSCTALPIRHSSRSARPSPFKAGKVVPAVARPVPRLQRFKVKAEEKEEPKAPLYADEEPEEGFFKSNEMSEAQKQKLRDEYYGFGGSPSKPMSSNLFLNIILFITFLAVSCAALGYI